MKKFSFFFGSSLFLFPALALAHEKWFIYPTAETPLGALSAWNQTTASFALATLFAFLVALILHFILRPLKWMRRLRSFLAAYKGWVSPVLRTLTGLLLFGASFSRFLFAPDLLTAGLSPSPEQALLSLQLVTGLGLVIGIFPRFMSVLGFVLYTIALFVFPLLNVLGYISFIGIFTYLFLVGDDSLPKVRGVKFFPEASSLIDFQLLKPYAMALLRIFTGVGFILVALFYKLLGLNIALDLVKLNPALNFVSALGFPNFTHEMFVLSGGLTEVLLGAMIIFGILPRLSGLVLIVCFTLTLQIFGISELLGHLPLYAVAFALLVHGGGLRWSAELVPALHPRGRAKLG